MLLATLHQSTGRLRAWWPGLLLLAALLGLATGCAGTSAASGNSKSRVEYGKASYYAMKFQGAKTASGERFSQSAKTAAHRTLPFGTQVRVTNLRNHKTVTVRINDRGPFVRGRIIDLSQSAFKAIGNLDQGLLEVKVEVIR